MESFNIVYDPAHDPDARPHDIINETVDQTALWLGTQHLAGFRCAIAECYSACLALSRRLVGLMALSLDLPADHWRDSMTCPRADMSFNYYRPREINEPYSPGIGAHTDAEVITILWQDRPGLTVYTPYGEWVDVPPLDGALLVTIGDASQRLTNNEYVATTHRVDVQGANPRLSIAFFQGKWALEQSKSVPPKY